MDSSARLLKVGLASAGIVASILIWKYYSRSQNEDCTSCDQRGYLPGRGGAIPTPTSQVTIDDAAETVNAAVKNETRPRGKTDTRCADARVREESGDTRRKESNLRREEPAARREEPAARREESTARREEPTAAKIEPSVRETKERKTEGMERESEDAPAEVRNEDSPRRQSEQTEGDDMCIGCNAPGRFRCSRCRVVRFCSVKCQRRSWKTHKLTCKVDKQQVPSSPKEPSSPVKAPVLKEAEPPHTAFEFKMAEGGDLVRSGRYGDAKRVFQKLYDEADPNSLDRGKAARLLASAMTCMFEDSEKVGPLLREALRLAHKHNDFVLTFDTLTVMAGEEKRMCGPEKASSLYEQALELCERRLGNLTWKQHAQGLANKACCMGIMGPQEAMGARELMNRASDIYSANLDDMDSVSFHSWIMLRCNKASLLAQTHPEVAVQEYQDTLKIFEIFPHPRLEEACRINLNNLDVPQPELDGRLFNTECPICMEPLGAAKFILKCRHAFHHQCFPGGVANGCPLCRS